MQTETKVQYYQRMLQKASAAFLKCKTRKDKKITLAQVGNFKKSLQRFKCLESKRAVQFQLFD